MGMIHEFFNQARTFLVCNESDGAGAAGRKLAGIIDGMRCCTAEELTAALRSAGFGTVQSDHRPSKPRNTVEATK